MISPFKGIFAVARAAVANLPRVLAALVLVAAPALAVNCCPTETQETLRTLSVAQIIDLQKCLLDGGFYPDNNPTEADGAIGKRTLAALDKAVRSCSASPAPSPATPPAGDAAMVCCPPAVQEKIGQLNDGEELSADDIREVQICLHNGNFYDSAHPAKVDGILGPNTEYAIARAVDHCALPRPVEQYVSSDCADGHEMVSYVLTAADLAVLKAAPKTGSDPPDSALTPELLASLALMQDADYPSRELFLDALGFFTQGIDTTSPVRERIQKHACKIHGADDTAAGWAAKSDVPMIYDLSMPTYGFYPFWLAAGPPANATGGRKDILPVDFSVLERIEWFGVTFRSDTEKLDLPPFMHLRDSTVSRKIQRARLLDTSVDLVVYRRESRENWLDLVSYDSSGTGQRTHRYLIEHLSNSIADEVGTPLTGFLNRAQTWFPEAFRSSPTYWDGVTLYFEGYPYDDPGAMTFLVDLLRETRSKLSSRERFKNFWNTARSHLALNVVLPFCNLVSDVPSCPQSQAESNKLTIGSIRPLIPKTLGETDNYNRAAGADDTVDAFIVFLPQPTSSNEEALRKSLENAFESSADKESMDNWRTRMLRKIACVLFPATWKWKGDFSDAGGQFHYDMQFSRNHFQGIGLWPLPLYSDANLKLAADIRNVFKLQGTDSIQTIMAPALVGIFGPGFADFFVAHRRGLFVFVVTVSLLLIIYGVCAYWDIDLREFFSRRFWWFVAAIAIPIAVLGFQFLFDKDLRNHATPFVWVLIIVGLGGYLARRTWLSEVEKDLP